MKYIQFQQSSDDMNVARPWPVIVSEAGDVIYGRPDARHLIGFGPMGTYEITVVTSKAIDDPSLAIGLRPTFQIDGDMFAVEIPVTSCAPYEADSKQIAHLTLRETAMREVLADE